MLKVDLTASPGGKHFYYMSPHPNSGKGGFSTVYGRAHGHPAAAAGVSAESSGQDSGGGHEEESGDEQSGVDMAQSDWRLTQDVGLSMAASQQQQQPHLIPCHQLQQQSQQLPQQLPVASAQAVCKQQPVCNASLGSAAEQQSHLQLQQGASHSLEPPPKRHKQDPQPTMGSEPQQQQHPQPIWGAVPIQQQNPQPILGAVPVQQQHPQPMLAMAAGHQKSAQMLPPIALQSQQQQQQQQEGDADSGQAKAEQLQQQQLQQQASSQQQSVAPALHRLPMGAVQIPQQQQQHKLQQVPMSVWQAPVSAVLQQQQKKLQARAVPLTAAQQHASSSCQQSVLSSSAAVAVIDKHAQRQQQAASMYGLPNVQHQQQQQQQQAVQQHQPPRTFVVPKPLRTFPNQQYETRRLTEASLTKGRLQVALEHLAAILKQPAGVSNTGVDAALQRAHVVEAQKHLQAALQAGAVQHEQQEDTCGNISMAVAAMPLCQSHNRADARTAAQTDATAAGALRTSSELMVTVPSVKHTGQPATGKENAVQLY